MFLKHAPPCVKGVVTMAKINSYIDSEGNTKYQFQIYTGTDPLTGKRTKTRRRGFTSSKQAEIALAHLQIEILENGGLKKKKQITTFQQVYDLWFDNYKRTVKESTWVTTARNFKLHILPIFKDYRIDKITVKECQSAIETWFKDGLANYRRFMNYVSNIFEYAINRGFIDSNPVDHVLKPIDRSKKLHASIENYYEKDDLKKFLDQFKESSNFQGYTFFRLLTFSGLRKGEALALEWDDLDFQNNTVSINKTQSQGKNNKLIIQTPKTERSERLAYLDDRTMKILKTWQIKQREYLLNFGFNINHKNNFVFSNQHNEMHQPVKPRKWMLTNIEAYNKSHVDQLKRVSVHGFRHTYATLAFESGASIKAVQEQLGHSSYQTTMDIYTAVTKKEQNDATEKLANYLNF